MNSNKELILHILILRCQTGDPGALAELIRQYESPLRYFITRLLGDLETAEDIFQDTWLSVLRRISTLRKAEAFPAWLYRIARNKVYRQLSRKKRLAEITESLTVTENAEEHDFSPEDAARIHKSMEVLKPQHKEVLMLRFLEQMSYQQMAEVLGCNIGTVRSRLYYAKEALKKEMEA
jgi:RNA polymerase sigma-70 factor (ECF subfamily)